MQYLRVKKQTEFQQLFHKGKRAFSPSLTIVYRKADKTRMGISIGKKHGKSVQRNHIKRLIREAFRLNVGEMKGQYAIVIIPKVRDSYSFETFYQHIQWIIKKENL